MASWEAVTVSEPIRYQKTVPWPRAARKLNRYGIIVPTWSEPGAKAKSCDQNTGQSLERKRRAVIRTQGRAWATALLLACCPCASALNPSLDISQYAHTSWTIRDGFLKGIINSIAQTPDGYLWLGTDFGLVLFDGVRFVPWAPPPGQHLPSGYRCGALLADARRASLDRHEQGTF